MSRHIATHDIMLQAAGMFKTDQVAKKHINEHRASHPLVLYTKGDFEKIKDIIDVHPEVESIMFVLDEYPCELFIAQILTFLMTLRVIIVSLETDHERINL